MNVQRPAFPIPILCIDDFLSEGDSEEVLRECIDLKKVYMPARVFDGPNVTRVDLRHRKNEVVYLDDVFRSAPERSDILRIMKSAIWTEACRALWHEGNYIFDVINYSTWQECVVARYGRGDFFKKHQDTRRDRLTYRLVTIVYYVNREPENFTGGSLVLWNKDECIRLPPKHNRAVVFPSFTSHEVEPVGMADEAGWEDARFSLNYWIGFK